MARMASATRAQLAAFTELALDDLPGVALLGQLERGSGPERADLGGRGLVLDVHREDLRVAQLGLEALDVGALGATLQRRWAVLDVRRLDQLVLRLRGELVACLGEVRVGEGGEV